MNTFQQVNIKKVGYDTGWENVIETGVDVVVLGSAHHAVYIEVREATLGGWYVRVPKGLGLGALAQEVAETFDSNGGWVASDWSQLAQLFRRISWLVQTQVDVVKLDDREQNVMISAYHEQVLAELSQISNRETEVERMVKQRVGQDIFRAKLMEYWGGSCAVTGIDIPEMLRASHIKSWADCVEDAERLDIYNGLLLVANLDALFDRKLITFDDSGYVIYSLRITPEHRKQLHLESSQRLRKITSEHRVYLRWHRETVVDRLG